MKRVIPTCIALVALAWTTGSQPAGLFDDEGLSEGERRSLEAQTQAADRAIEALDTLRLPFLAQQMKKGDCSAAIEIEGKAKSGDAESQWLLADLHRIGLCVEQSVEETVRLLEAASQQGYVQAQYELGLAYYRGTGVKKDYAQAVRNFSEASEGGIAEAARALGIIYRDGEGVPQDIQQTLSWFERAIELGSVEAAASAAWLFLDEDANRVDPERALAYSLPAADKGDEAAQLLSALALVNLPEAKPENFIEAHKWANLASTSSVQQIADPSRELRSQLEAKMAQSDIETAQQRASEWKLVQKGVAPLQPEEAGQIQPVQLPVVDPLTVEQLNSQEAKLRLKQLGVPIDKDSYFEAAKTDNLGVFKLFHKSGADLETHWGSARVTPLYMATNYDARSVFDYLLAEGANVNVADQEGQTPIVRAISRDQRYMIDRLLDAGASARQDPNGRGIFGGSPLQYAIIGDDPDLIRRLFKHGASVDELYARKETPLMLAASKSREVFQVLIEYGADPNSVDENGKSVLHHILEPPIDTVILHLALEAGADPNSEAGIPITPLLGAVYAGDPGAVKQLLDYGARLDRTYAINQGEIPMAFPEDVRRIIMNEGTALMVAAQLRHASVAKILLIYGADENQKIAIEGTQFRASDFACDAGHDLVCNMLK